MTLLQAFYVEVGILLGPLLSAALGAWICWQFTKNHYHRADFWIKEMRGFWESVDRYQGEVRHYRQERDQAQAEVVKLERKLGQALVQRDEIVVAYRALAEAPPVPAPSAEDATAWKALLLACNELEQRPVEGRASTTVDGWVSYFLNGAANAGTD